MSSLRLTLCYSGAMTDDRKARFSAWLRDAMAREDLQQADLARLVGVTTGIVSRWYNGHTLPSSANAIRIAKALGEERDYVLDLAGHRPLPSSTTDLTDPRVLFFASHARELTEEEWAIIRDLIERFAKD